MAQVQLTRNAIEEGGAQQMLLDAEEIGKLGYRCAFFGVTALQATTCNGTTVTVINDSLV